MKKNIFPIFILFFFLGSFSFGFLSVKQSSLHTLIPIAYADDDEDDDDDDDACCFSMKSRISGA